MDARKSTTPAREPPAIIAALGCWSCVNAGPWVVPINCRLEGDYPYSSLGLDKNQVFGKYEEILGMSLAEKNNR